MPRHLLIARTPTYTPAGELLLVATFEGEMRFWPVDDLLRGDDRPAGHFSAYGRILYDVAVHPNGDLIAALSSDYGGILLFGVPAEE